MLRIYTSTCISRLFFSGTDKIGIEKMRSIFFQRGKSSDVAGTQPAVEAKTLKSKEVVNKSELLPII